mgnify:CR=1 FL=1
MKKLIFKKFLKDVTGFVLLVSISITLIVWVIQAVNFLDFVSEDGHSFKVYFYYTILHLPKIFSRVLPFIFFISVFYIIIKYENNNELVIFWTTGIKKIDFAKVLIKYSLLYIFLQISFYTYIVPKSQDLARSFIRSSNVDFFPSLIKPGKFIDTVSNLTIFIDNETANGQFNNIFLKDSFNEEQSQIISAKTGRIIKQDKNNYLILEDGKFINNDRGEITVFSFEKTEFNLSKYQTKTTITPKVQELSTLLILKCYMFIQKENNEFYKKYSQNSKINYGSLRCVESFLSPLKQEIFKRFYMPFYFPLICLISCLLITKSKDNYNYTKFKFLLFSTGIFVIILSELSVRYSGINNWYSSLFISIPIFLFLITYLYFFKKAKT